MQVFWSPSGTPDELVPGLRALGEEYPIREGSSANALRVRFSPGGEPSVLRVTQQDGELVIAYDTPTRAYRALGGILSRDGAGAFQEAIPFTTFGIMIDCSRNAVPTVDFLKRWIRRLALLGYNMVMLYTEDTYEVPEEPFFGYLRGGYTQAELREIDAYASGLGIEVIPCIQTLGHLAQVLRWPAFEDVADTGQILLAGEEKTYRLLERMIRAASGPFRTHRIHIGMDEAHDLGRGKYMDRLGFRRNFDIFNDHLTRVLDICTNLNLKPMIWSDMYFRMGSRTGDYYDPETIIPEEVTAAIPEGVQLVYWDYYHKDEGFYSDWIERHRSLAGTPIVGSGIWTWSKLWYDHRITSANVVPCLEACKEQRVEEVFFTLWGDDGAECDRDSALAGLAWAAEVSYDGSVEGGSDLARRFSTVCGGDYGAHIMASDMEYAGQPDSSYGPARGYLWDDILLGIFCRSAEGRNELSTEHVADAYRSLGDVLSRLPIGKAGDLRHAERICRVLARKMAVRKDLLEAYGEGDREALGRIAETEIPLLQQSVQELWASHRKLWLSQNKPFGFEVLSIRYGGLNQRLEEVRLRIGEYLAGDLGSIAELDHVPPPVPQVPLRYRSLAASSAIL